MRPRSARGARLVLTVNNELYLEAARLHGRRLFSHRAQAHRTQYSCPVIILTTLSMSTAILTEAALKFPGAGHAAARSLLGQDAERWARLYGNCAWVTVFPGIAIVIAVLGFNLLGDGLRDALDPRLKE